MNAEKRGSESIRTLTMEDKQLSRAGSIYEAEKTSGDAAVDGLFSGVAAGVGMILYLALAGLSVGDAPLVMLVRFAPVGVESPLGGVLLHVAVSGIYGVLFALAWHLTGRRWFPNTPVWTVVGIGVGYGWLLLILAQFVLLPGTGSALLEFPPAHFAIAHLVYGATLGFLMGRNGWKSA